MSKHLPRGAIHAILLSMALAGIATLAVIAFSVGQPQSRAGDSALPWLKADFQR